MSKLNTLTDDELHQAQFDAFMAYVQSLGEAGDVQTLLALVAQAEAELDRRRQGERTAARWLEGLGE